MSKVLPWVGAGGIVILIALTLNHTLGINFWMALVFALFITM